MVSRSGESDASNGTRDQALEARHQIEEAKFEAAIGNRALADLGLTVGIRAALGHVSMRVPGQPNLFAVKGRGYRIDVIKEMRPEDMVICDLEGDWVDGPPWSLQCGEVKIHSCIYRERPDVQSVVHVHPDYVVLTSVLGITLRPIAQEGNRAVLDPLPVYAHQKTVNSEEEGMEVVKLLGQGSAIILQGHGAVTASTRDVSAAVMSMANLEHQARLNFLAVTAMGKDFPAMPRELVMEQGRGTEPHHARRLEQVPGGRAPDARWEYFRENLGTL